MPTAVQIAYNNPMPPIKNKEGRFEMRPSPAATHIMGAASRAKGISRASVVELALRLYAKDEGIPIPAELTDATDPAAPTTTATTTDAKTD